MVDITNVVLGEFFSFIIRILSWMKRSRVGETLPGSMKPQVSTNPTSAGTMIDRLRLINISMVKFLVLFFLTGSALCDRDSLAEVIPIVLPPSELWYVAPWTSQRSPLS